MTHSQIATVESVSVKASGILVNATHKSRPSVTFSSVPILAGFSGLIAVPQPGQRVIISETQTGFEYVEGILTGPNDPGPELVESEFALQLDPTTTLKITKDGVGGYDTLLQSSGDVQVDAGGDILIGEGGTPVARQDHTHDYSWTDAGGSDTTPTPNEDGTNTTIE